jgi:hypothetical protein
MLTPRICYRPGSKWSDLIRHLSLLLLMMLISEEVERSLRRPVVLPLTSEVQHDNHFDCFLSAVFSRWRRLGILSLARLDRLITKRMYGRAL